MKKYIIALDQGTTSSRCIIFDEEQNAVASAQKEFRQFFPRAGWVEHDPMEILSSQKTVLEEALERSGIPVRQVSGVGISNQRETAVVWEKDTGRPIYNAIVWQCRRTAAICEQLKAAGHGKYIRQSTGLPVDAYFSATKVKWILDYVPGARERAQSGELLFGTVDTWLLWNLTDGRVHATDLTNASRTMMFNIKTLTWDEKILDILDIPAAMLPVVKYSGEYFGDARVRGTLVPIAGIAGDQQAALFGQACFSAGQVKNTYGTGCFMLMNTEQHLRYSKNGLLTTLAATQKGPVHYALEGSVFMAGATIQWLRDELHLLHDAADSEYFAAKVEDNGGVYLVPAHAGLGAPYWDMYARGIIVGLTRGCKSEHIIRAALEGIAYQVRDLLSAMEKDTSIKLGRIKVDGGACANNFLMQFQADITGTPVMRPLFRESTALGAAGLAGLTTGVWKDTGELESLWRPDRLFEPGMPPDRRDRLVRGWHKAVDRAKEWALEDD